MNSGSGGGAPNDTWTNRGDCHMPRAWPDAPRRARERRAPDSSGRGDRRSRRWLHRYLHATAAGPIGARRHTHRPVRRRRGFCGPKPWRATRRRPSISCGWMVTTPSSPDTSKRQPRGSMRDPDLDFVSCAMRAFEGASYVWTPPTPTFVEAIATGGVPHASTMLRRRLWEAVGGFDETLRSFELLDFWASAIRARVPRHHSRRAVAQLSRPCRFGLQTLDPAGDLPRPPSPFLCQASRLDRATRAGVDSGARKPSSSVSGSTPTPWNREPPRSRARSHDSARRSRPLFQLWNRKGVPGRHGATCGVSSRSVATGAGIEGSPSTGITSRVFSTPTGPTFEAGCSRSGIRSTRNDSVATR